MTNDTTLIFVSVLEEESSHGSQLDPTWCEQAEHSNQRSSVLTPGAAASDTKDSPQAASQSHSPSSCKTYYFVREVVVINYLKFN